MTQLREVAIDDVRTAVREALGDARADRLPGNASLVQSGTISSLEIVAVAAALEKRFGVRVPDSAVTIANFDTLAAMASLVAGGRRETALGEVPPATPGWNSAMRSLAGALRRPVMLLILMLAWLFALDIALLGVMKGPLAARFHEFLESGNRLYPVSGGYSTDDLRFSVAQHNILTAPDGIRPRVAVFGDSSTIGSWVDYKEAIPNEVEIALRRTYSQARVFNLAFFMQFLAKDLMILEAVMELKGGAIPFDVAVFTLGDPYTSRGFMVGLKKAMPYLLYNRELLARFAERLPAEYRDTFDSFLADLRPTGARAFLMNWLTLHSALFHYAPFFRFFVDEVPFIETLNPQYNFYAQYQIGRKPLYSPVPPQPPAGVDLHIGIPEADFDPRVVSMLDTAVTFLHERGVKVVLFLKPHGPKEWQQYYKQGENTTARDIAEKLCAGGRCSIVDTRWSLSGSQFTDSLAHYNAEANRMIGESIADAVIRELRQ